MAQAILKITGTVQGVFYRAHAKEKAQTLGITGYAKNMPDGSVEILAQGERDKIEKLIEWCSEGPDASQVDNVEAEWREPQGKPEEFEIL
ncbi:MAG: acylphosphatase [Patescibacteria group bacterium]|nr:acylphosphatase [Patescibacteria group bacterium]